MNVDLIIPLETAFTLFALIDLSQRLTSCYIAIAHDFIRHITLNELCEVDVNFENVSDENLGNILFCYSLGNWSLLNASIKTVIWRIQKHFSRSII